MPCLCCVAGPRKTIVSNFVAKVGTQLCVAASDWPIEGKETRQPSLSFRRGEQVIVLESSAPGGSDDGGFVEGFTEHDMDRVAWFPRACLEA
jgi:hypothetical protein